ncbi:MAG: CCA tRNA nucleotidyltransferase [Thermodesulfobacteriota bacterium]
MREKILEDPILLKLANLSKEQNVSLFLVGGFLRDLLLGTTTKDYDFALPREAASFISSMEESLGLRFFKVGKEERETLTYRLVHQDMSIDLTFLQGESIDQDILRRDFTVNTIAFSLRDETFHQAEGAWEDIQRKVIRTVSKYSIDQDPLRMLRAIRYVCALDGFVLDPQLKEEIFQKRERVQHLPGERIKMELDHILLSPKPALGLRTLYESGLLLTLFPDLKGLEHLGQSQHHHLRVLSHTLLIVEKLSWAFDWVASTAREFSLTQQDRLVLSYAALFHDLGKQDTYSKDEKGKVHFYYHESFSSQRAERLMERLRFSNLMKNKILHLIQNHMRILNLSRETKETALKRLVYQVGDDIPLLVLLTLADKEASRGILSVQLDEVIEDHCVRILKWFKEKDVIHPPPLINGHDVMALGYSPGPKVGEILNFIRGKQIEGEIKTREEALRLLKEEFGD